MRESRQISSMADPMRFSEHSYGSLAENP